MLVLDVFEKHLDDLAHGWAQKSGKRHNGVPISSILARLEPIEAGKVVSLAIDKMVIRAR